VWAYDMFNGTFPTDTLWDSEDGRLISAIAPQCNGNVLAELSALGVTCVQGLFPMSFWFGHPKSVSFVHVDMDTYVTTISALELFHHLMIPGGYFLIHDYAHSGLGGVGRALAEFKASALGAHYDYRVEGDHMRLDRRIDADV
jgi:hypothetical protein